VQDRKQKSWVCLPLCIYGLYLKPFVRELRGLFKFPWKGLYKWEVKALTISTALHWGDCSTLVTLQNKILRGAPIKYFLLKTKVFWDSVSCSLLHKDWRFWKNGTFSFFRFDEYFVYPWHWILPYGMWRVVAWSKKKGYSW